MEQLKTKRLGIENANLSSENKELKIDNSELKERLGLNSSILRSRELYKRKSLKVRRK
ncbi:MAG: hypothetical protein KTV77_04620 [Wolbachia endosymbiont of Fragariocoptes setiger]|nr:hypothetical protein [Wolbachia endosymbiont of Fragariocoptes setiger]